MKIHICGFLRRGITACGLGPIVLAICYLMGSAKGAIDTLTVSEVCIGIFSLSGLAFIAGGINQIYQSERIPLMVAIAIHGSILYISYLITYLINNWLEWKIIQILVFTGIFVVGYILIWAIIYNIIRRKTQELNIKLKLQQGTESEH